MKIDGEILKVGRQPNLNSVPALLLLLTSLAVIPVCFSCIQRHRLIQDMAHMKKLIKKEGDEVECLSAYARLFNHPRMPKAFTWNLLVALSASAANISISCIVINFFDLHNAEELFPSNLLCPEFATVCYSPTNDLLRVLFWPCLILASFAFGLNAFSLLFHLIFLLVPPYRGRMVAGCCTDKVIQRRISKVARKLSPEQCYFFMYLEQEESLKKEQAISILHMVAGTKEEKNHLV